MKNTTFFDLSKFNSIEKLYEKDHTFLFQYENWVLSIREAYELKDISFNQIYKDSIVFLKRSKPNIEILSRTTTEEGTYIQIVYGYTNMFNDLVGILRIYDDEDKVHFIWLERAITEGEKVDATDLVDKIEVY